MEKTFKKWVFFYEIKSPVDFESDEPITYDEALTLAYEEGKRNLGAFAEADPE